MAAMPVSADAAAGAAYPPATEPAVPTQPVPAWLTAPVLKLAIPDSPFAAGGAAGSAPTPEPETGSPVAEAEPAPEAIHVPLLIEPVAEPGLRRDIETEIAAILAAAPVAIEPVRSRRWRSSRWRSISRARWRHRTPKPLRLRRRRNPPQRLPQHRLPQHRKLRCRRSGGSPPPRAETPRA